MMTDRILRGSRNGYFCTVHAVFLDTLHPPSGHHTSWQDKNMDPYCEGPFHVVENGNVLNVHSPPRFRVEKWEAETEYIITVNGHPVGNTVEYSQGVQIRDWLRSSFQELKTYS